MRRLLAVGFTLATSGLILALPVAPAAADSASGESTGNGSYKVQVSVTGNGVGTGGSLTGGDGISSSGGTVSVPSPCGYDGAQTQQAIEASYGGDKERYKEEGMGHQGGPMSMTPENYPITYPWQQGIYDNWGKQGTWYLPGCDTWGQLVKFAGDNKPVLVGPGGAAGPPTPVLDPKFLEDIAVKAMTLPTPYIRYNPKAGGDGRSYVNVPGGTWFWAEQRPAGAGKCTASPCSVTASASGVSVTVTATLDNLTFTTNGATKNGRSSVSCPDGGKPYTRGSSSDTSDCVLEYTRSSGAGKFTVDAAATWSASSSLGNPIAGSVMRDQILLTVGEIQTVNR